MNEKELAQSICALLAMIYRDNPDTCRREAVEQLAAAAITGMIVEKGFTRASA